MLASFFHVRRTIFNGLHSSLRSSTEHFSSQKDDFRRHFQTSADRLRLQMRSSALVTSHRCCFDFVIKLSKSLCNIIFDGLKQRFAEIVEHSSPCDLAHRAQSSCPSIDCTRRSEKNLYTALKFFYVQAYSTNQTYQKKYPLHYLTPLHSCRQLSRIFFLMFGL